LARVTPSTATASETAWQEDTWYGVTLREWEIEPKGTPGYKGQPTKHARLIATWQLNTNPEDWIFDWISLTVSQQADGTHAKAKLLICALAGRDPRQEQTPWIDDETLEYGFDAEAQIPAGRISTGTAVALKGHVIQDSNKFDRLRVDRYGGAHLGSPQQVSAPPAPMVSPDGRYQWDGSAWVPLAASSPPPPPPAPAPVPAPAAAPVQQELI